MQTLAIIGSQWGDEGKGKITDLLSAKSDIVLRFQGGNNAGHTIIVDEKKIVLHLIPSGILHDHCTSIISHGVVLDPEAFKKELDDIEKANIHLTPKRLLISENCPLITSYNKILDSARENQGPLKIGTTGKGIGPAYEDKISRKAIKLRDLRNKRELIAKLDRNIHEKKILFRHLYQIDYPSVEMEAQRLLDLGEVLLPFAQDTFTFLDQAIQANKKILFEGAQGILLDIDYGSYPFVTSSNTSIGGIYTGSGLMGKQVDEVLGITKAYTTRVGEGPFPTELKNDQGRFIQQKGSEFGATTGRTRRCGWLDLPLLKYSIKASNLTSLALTKIDVLSGLDELKICTAYKYNGQIIDCAQPGIDMYAVEPIFSSMKTFNDTFEDQKTSPELTEYINLIEKHTKIPVGILAYGPERKQIFFRKNYF